MITILLCDQLAKVAGRSCFQCAQPDPPTVKAALGTIFSRSPGLARYVLDGAGGLDARTAVFLDSASLRDRRGLSDELPESGTLHVMRSLGPPFGMCWSSDWREHRMARVVAATRDRESLGDQRLVLELAFHEDA